MWPWISAIISPTVHFTVGIGLFRNIRGECRYFKRDAVEFVTIDILGPFIESKKRYQFVVEMTYRYGKLTRAISMPRVTVPLVAKVGLEHCIITYEIPIQYLLAMVRSLCQGSSQRFAFSLVPS